MIRSLARVRHFATKPPPPPKRPPPPRNIVGPASISLSKTGGHSQGGAAIDNNGKWKRILVFIGGSAVLTAGGSFYIMALAQDDPSFYMKLPRFIQRMIPSDENGFLGESNNDSSSPALSLEEYEERQRQLRAQKLKARERKVQEYLKQNRNLSQKQSRPDEERLSNNQEEGKSTKPISNASATVDGEEGNQKTTSNKSKFSSDQFSLTKNSPQPYVGGNPLLSQDPKDVLKMVDEEIAQYKRDHGITSWWDCSWGLCKRGDYERLKELGSRRKELESFARNKTA
eukprot:g2853.t1